MIANRYCYWIFWNIYASTYCCPDCLIHAGHLFPITGNLPACETYFKCCLQVGYDEHWHEGRISTALTKTPRLDQESFVLQRGIKNKAMSGREWIGILVLSMSTDVAYIYTNSTYTGTSRPQHSQPFPPP